jgi:L-alanine-DL-glutamate epimerase-like enolase superfamily enzyme
MAPHAAGGPLMYSATLHVDAVIPNFLIQETNYFDQFSLCVEHDWKIKDGYIGVSDAPGLGVQVKEQDLHKLEYKPLEFRQYRHTDGSWKGW